MSDFQKFLEDLFFTALNEAQEKAKTATGASPEDRKYSQAESVRRHWENNVFVTFEGVEYGPVRGFFGPLDGDKEKSTVNIKTDAGVYWMLWFYDKDVK